MADEPEIIPQTFLQKLLFYTTAFFVLLGTFSLFAFLFLVPFVIDPAFTTIFSQFDPDPALCVTVEVQTHRGVSNCSWSSCREGCTREMYECTQIRVNYKLQPRLLDNGTELLRVERAIRDYDYLGQNYFSQEGEERDAAADTDAEEEEELETELKRGLMGNDSEWYYVGAKLFPNVKGCGYPPMLNCSIFNNTYAQLGKNFSCYYSKVDPEIVIHHLDMHQVYMNLVYSMAIPIPSFIISVIYLTFAYFVIYAEDEQEALMGEGAETEGEGLDGATPVPPALTPGSDTFREDLVSFGHQLKVAMADEMSRESVADAVSNSMSIPGNLSKTMTTSISTPAGPIADV